MTETVTIETRACMFCGASSRVELTARQAAALAARRPVQDVLPDVERLLAAGERSLRSLAGLPRARILDAGLAAQLAPDGGLWRNANTPAEFAEFARGADDD